MASMATEYRDGEFPKPLKTRRKNHDIFKWKLVLHSENKTDVRFSLKTTGTFTEISPITEIPILHSSC